MERIDNLNKIYIIVESVALINPFDIVDKKY
jgi:hypothetical protein